MQTRLPTEHRQAEQALQRSEALLSHLVANSPDLITLTELSSGRYLMVNPSFTRVAGWTAEEAVGHEGDIFLQAALSVPRM